MADGAEADDAPPPALGLAELRSIVFDGAELAKGARIVDDGGLAHLARHGKKLFADAAGSQLYKVQLAFADGGGAKARCSCMAARSRPFCKHAAALLVAWARMPEAFAVADAPPVADEDKKKRVKQGAVKNVDLMGQGVAQVATLVRELAVAGVATIADDRAPQVRALGENLRELRLRRLSGKTIALAELLAGARAKGAVFDEAAYAELVGDLLLTSRKLEKHLAGEPLDDRQVEELIGKTWTKKDRAPVEGLDLLEVAFLAHETADDFVIRESRFVELASGRHYSEKQIVPRFLARRTTPKLSHAGLVLVGASGSQYPSYPPHRLDLRVCATNSTSVQAQSTFPVDKPIDRADELCKSSQAQKPGERVAVTGEHLARLRAAALPDVRSAIAALQEQRRDLFAPDLVPVAVTCDTLIADRGRLQLVDASGAGVFLPADERLADRLATALAGVTLVMAIGDLGLDGALPTLYPLALLVERTRDTPDGPRATLELRGVTVPAAILTRRRKVATAPGVHWAATARALGLSGAAIVVGEVREELAAILYAGLGTATPRRVEPLVARLRDLGLGKPADTLAALAARPDPAERLDDLVKLHQALGVALARLTGAATVDREQLEASPLYASVFVRKPDEVLPPADIAARVARGGLDRYEAAARYAAYYATVPADQLLDRPYPTWADGSASPFVALAARRDPARARATAEALLLATGGPPAASAAPVAAPQPQPPTARRLAAPRMALVTAVRVLDALGSDALLALRAVAERHGDLGIRSLAAAAVRRATLGEPAPSSWRAAIVSAPGPDERLHAIGHAVEQGDTSAIPNLRLAFAGDPQAGVREAAARALALLGDADSADSFIAALERRADDGATAAIAARALGHLGDVRGLHALLDAYQTGWRPEVVADALAALGPAAIPELVAVLEQRPTLLKRRTARAVVDSLPTAALQEALLARLDALTDTPIPDLLPAAKALFAIASTRPDLAHPFADRLRALHPTLRKLGTGSRGPTAQND